jgi:hypothetical protein
MRRILLCLSLVACVSLPAAAQNAKPARPAVGPARSELTYNREILSDSESRIAAINWVNTDCSSGGIPTVRFVTRPQNGTIRTEETLIPSDRPASDTRSSCNGKPVQALAIFYKPNAGNTGADNVVVDVDFHMGSVRRHTYKITVR